MKLNYFLCLSVILGSFTARGADVAINDQLNPEQLKKLISEVKKADQIDQARFKEVSEFMKSLEKQNLAPNKLQEAMFKHFDEKAKTDPEAKKMRDCLLPLRKDMPNHQPSKLEMEFYNASSSATTQVISEVEKQDAKDISAVIQKQADSTREKLFKEDSGATNESLHDISLKTEPYTKALLKCRADEPARVALTLLQLELSRKIGNVATTPHAAASDAGAPPAK